MAFDLRTLIHLSQSCFVFVAIVIAVSSTSGSESNETQEVTNLMDELFHEHQACNVPAMELGFLVSGSYSEPSEEGERPFRKALDFVKKTAQKIKISDSGSHVGLVVYGENPYMAFDFNEYFDMPSLAQAIEEVKTPVKGSNIEEALKFAKKQLYDKSARPGVPKKLIILLSKKSQEMTNHGLELLKKAGVKVYTMRIKAESDPLEMSDSAADARNSFVTDQDHLGSLVARVVPKLCEAPTELGEASDETSKNKMDPDEEPGEAVNSLTTPGIPRLPSKQEATTNEGPRPNKVDLVFLIESTGKMGVANWKKTIAFMKYVTHAFDVSKDGTKVGIVTEGHTFYIVVDFNRIVKKPLLMGVMGLIPLPFGNQKIGKGLKDVKELVINPSGRPNIPHVVIVLTDGNSADDVRQPAKILQESGAEVFAVGLGADVSLTQLEKIASYPRAKYVYHGNFKDVVKIASKVVAQIYDKHFCGGLNTLLTKLLRKREMKRRKVLLKVRH